MITNPVVPMPTSGASGNAGVIFLQKVIPAAISFGFVVGAVVFFFMLIIGAIQWISSGGDKQAIESARGKLVNAIIGLVILFAVFAIIQLLNSFFNIHLLNLTLPTLTGTGPQATPYCGVNCPPGSVCIPDTNGGMCKSVYNP